MVRLWFVTNVKFISNNKLNIMEAEIDLEK